MTEQPDCLEVCVGNKRAVFPRTDEGWACDWFYEDDRPMMRFKDHEWLCIGHVHPTCAKEAERLPDGGIRFTSVDHYGTTRVDWEITVQPDPLGVGFVIDCILKPEKSIELLEAYCFFETPYDYDGTETATGVAGMNPAVKWEGNKQISPPTWNNPAWAYTRPQEIRITAPCDAPILCQALEPINGEPPRYITVVGDWTVCRVRDVCSHPTRNCPGDPPSAFASGAETRGYKYCMGAPNWSTCFIKDWNVLFEHDQPNRQRVALDFSSDMPGGTLDTFFYRAWERACAFSFPADARIEAYERVTGRGVTWETALQWLRDVFAGDKTSHFFKTDGPPYGGFSCYCLGSRPKAWDSYNWGNWCQWGPNFHYRALLTGDEALAARCREYDKNYAEQRKDAPLSEYHSGTMPVMWWAYRHGGQGILADVVKPIAEAQYRESVAENGKERYYDGGGMACTAHGLLLSFLTLDKEKYRDQGMLVLDEVNDRLDTKFWAFNGGAAKSLVHGGQIRSLGHGNAVLANMLAADITGEARYMEYAHRFARYLLSLCYACHNSSRDPDFDFRGWCNGSNGGRDQIAEFPPWETTYGLLSLVSLMSELDLEGGFHDLVWYFARTGLAQFPAARTLKRLYKQNGDPVYVPRDSLGSEPDFFDVDAYLAYENPRDQTLLVGYQGADCVLGELVFAGGLARAGDPRLGVVVPNAAVYDLEVASKRDVLVWNPTQDPIESIVTNRWPDGSTDEQSVTAPPRQATKLHFDK